MPEDGAHSGLAAWPPGRASLRWRLVAAALCLLAAGAAIITVAGAVMARDSLAGQANGQVLAYAGQLTSGPFAVSPLYGVAPGGRGAVAPGGGLSIEVRGPGGQVVMRRGAGTGPGPVIPALPAGMVARAGQPVTVAARGGGDPWLVVAEPIHYRVRRIPFSYSADGFSVFVTSLARPGVAGTLMVGLDLGSIGHTKDRLAVTGLAVSAVALVLAACLGAAVTGALLRPLPQAAAALAAVAAGGLSCRVPDRPGGSTAGRLAASLNAMLSHLEHALSERAVAEAAARESARRMSHSIAGVSSRLRGPLSIIHGLALTYRRGPRPRAGELDRIMRRVASEAAHLETLARDLPAQPRTDRQAPGTDRP